MSRPIRLILSCLLLLGSLVPTLPAASFDEANAAQASGDFSGAARSLQQLIDREGASAARLFHLGNAQAGLKQYGSAILSYERARLLAPRDSDIQTNLMLARKAAATPETSTSLPWWKRPLYQLSLHEWSWLAAGGSLLMGLAALTWGLRHDSRPPWPQATTAALILGLMLGSAAGFALWQRSGEKHLGIITAAKPTLRLSPFSGAAATDSPGTGRHVILGESRQGWIHLTLPDSQLAGWLPEAEVAPLMPRS